MRKIKRKCKCGCGHVTNYGKKWLCGHNGKVNNPIFKHGLYNHKLYNVWRSMKNRCSNINNQAYGNYGGRGIRVCIRWQKSFISFYNWAVTSGYKQGLQIDREDNNGNYTPSNCRFVTCSVNSSNRR